MYSASEGSTNRGMKDFPKILHRGCKDYKKSSPIKHSQAKPDNLYEYNCDLAKSTP